MQLCKKTLEKLRNLINEETEYRSGPKLVAFFNQLGFQDSYQQGFPSRWIYTDDRLENINGKPELDQCIKLLFDPINFVDRYVYLDKLIFDFNKFLAYDGWQVVRIEKAISFNKAGPIDFSDPSTPVANEDKFLEISIKEISFDCLNLDSNLVEVLKARLEELKICLSAKGYLASIILSGSILEGVLLGLALNNPRIFNQASSSPKDQLGKVKSFHDWGLSNLIDVSFELGFILSDVKKFSHSLRDFRNYIHPYSQLCSGFYPNKHTAQICFQVLKAAIFEISEKMK